MTGGVQGQKVLVAKFGGSILADGQGYKVLADTVESLIGEGYRPIVVVSAMKGATDTLFRAASLAQREESVEPLLRDLMERYTSAAHEAVEDREHLAKLLGEMNTLFTELFKLVWAVRVIGETAPHVEAMIVSYGEMLSAALAASVLRSRGVEARWLHGGAAGLVAAGGSYREAVVDYHESSRRVQERLQPLIENGIVPVVMGYTAYNRNGQTVLLGRGGSDYTATLLARFTGAWAARLYTDVDGVYTSDPRRIPEAMHIPRLGLDEAVELALLGAKKMHPRTFEPVEGTSLRVSITRPGAGRETLVMEGVYPPPVKAVVVQEGLTAVHISGGGLAERVGIMARISRTAADAGVNLKAIIQPPTETRITLIVGREDGPLLARRLEEDLSTLRVDVDYDHASLVSVVGWGLRDATISSKVFKTASSHGGAMGAIWAPGGSIITLISSPANAWSLAEALHGEVLMEWWRGSQ